VLLASGLLVDALQFDSATTLDPTMHAASLNANPGPQGSLQLPRTDSQRPGYSGAEAAAVDEEDDD
jgi:hypothetical protein